MSHYRDDRQPLRQRNEELARELEARDRALKESEQALADAQAALAAKDAALALLRPAPAADPEPARSCWYCAQQNPAHAEFCVNCRARLDRTIQPATLISRRSEVARNPMIDLGALIFFFFLLGALIYVLR